MDKVLVTGGTGFVGWHMSLTQPKKTDCYYFNRKKYDEEWWEYQDWKYIIHLAPIEPSRAIACAKRNNARLLYCSSGIVYHPENDNEYRRNKIKWEQECLDSGVDVVIARPFAFYGERLDDNKAYSQFEKAAKAGQTIRITGSGQAVRSYMHGYEMGIWLWAILLHGQRGEAYDVGSDAPITILELARQLNCKYNNPSEIIIEGGADPMPSYLPVDTAKTRKLLSL